MWLLNFSLEKRREIWFLALLTGFCIFSIVFRMYYSQSVVFFFLIWNLFLATIPWLVTSLMNISAESNHAKWKVAGALMVWLLFFPNAPYILTDLFHLRRDLNMPIWFDLLLILSFAWTGLLFGLFSLLDIEKLLARFMHRNYVVLICSLLLFLSGFGIYLGRYLRWNSWDVVSEPYGIIQDIGHRFVYPFDHPRTWGMTIFMGIFLNMVYWSFRHIGKKTR